jgi:hypothetical protein
LPWQDFLHFRLLLWPKKPKATKRFHKVKQALLALALVLLGKRVKRTNRHLPKPSLHMAHGLSNALNFRLNKVAKAAV